MAEWTIAKLSKAHDRAGFSCGRPLLDAFLHVHASQYEKRRLARTYVVTEVGSPKIAGYYTLATGSLDTSTLPESLRKKLTKHPIPTVHLGRLAVDTQFRGLRLGEMLLLNALKLALHTAEQVGIFGVDVSAIDDEAGAFYRKYGFVVLEDAPHHLLLSLKTYEAASKP